MDKSSKLNIMMVGLVRAIFYILLFYIIYKIVHFFSALNKASKSPSEKKQISGTMVKDGICNTYLPKEDAIRYIHQGNEYFFCSETCKKKFLLEIKK